MPRLRSCRPRRSSAAPRIPAAALASACGRLHRASLLLCLRRRYYSPRTSSDLWSPTTGREFIPSQTSNYSSPCPSTPPLRFLSADRRGRRRPNRTSSSLRSQCLRITTVSEKVLFAPHDDRKEHEPVFVDEVVLHKRPYELVTAEDQNVPTGLPLQPGHFLCDILS